MPGHLIRSNREWIAHVVVHTGLNGIRHVGDVAEKHAASLAGREREAPRHARLCELNVIEQNRGVAA